MKSKTITVGGFIIVVLFFLLYFTIFYSMEKSNQSITSNLQNISIYAQQENWNEASEAVNRLEQRWDKINHLLTLNYAEADYFVIVEYFGRIKSDVKLQEKQQTVTDVSAVLNIWKNLTKVIPQP